jgi:hypothetical protein
MTSVYGYLVFELPRAHLLCVSESTGALCLRTGPTLIPCFQGVDWCSGFSCHLREYSVIHRTAVWHFRNTAAGGGTQQGTRQPADPRNRPRRCVSSCVHCLSQWNSQQYTYFEPSNSWLLNCLC